MKNKNKVLSISFILIVISLPIFIGAMDLTVVSAVLPQLVFELELPLQTGLDEASWIVTGYLLMYSISMLFMGRFSDVFGRRRSFILSLSIFALGSVLVAISTDHLSALAARMYYLLGGSSRLDMSQVRLWTIVFSRMVQALGGGGMVPVGMAMVSDLFPEGGRAKAIGMIAAVDTAGWVIGHLYGGIIVRYFNWQLIFWINLPFCLLTFIFLLFLPKKSDSETRLKMDWTGLLIASGFLLFLNLGLGSPGESKNAFNSSNSNGINPYWLILSFVFLVFFIIIEKRKKHAIIHTDMFKKKNFTFALLGNLLIGAAMFISIANVPLYINSLVAETLEQGAWQSGWILSALTVPIALASWLGGWITERKGYLFPAVLGIILCIIGFALMSQWQIDSDFIVLVPELIITGTGFGLTMAPIAVAVIDAARKDNRGISSALVLTFRLVGMTAGISGITSFGLHRADVLMDLWINSNMTSAEVYKTSLDVMMTVIQETFIIAGILIVLALIPILFIKNPSRRNHESIRISGIK